MKLNETGAHRHIALIGNPNTGKSTLFSGLVGVHQRVGNYPGVTVERRTGRFDAGGHSCELIDLPGVYSLSPRSEDEAVAVRELLGLIDSGATASSPRTAAPDAVICVVDACNLKRNLYIVNQLLELGFPTVIALNMVDRTRRQGISLDVAMLEQRLGVPVISVEAVNGVGLDRLRETLVEVMDQDRRPPHHLSLPNVVKEQLRTVVGSDDQPLHHYVALRCLMDDSGSFRRLVFPSSHDSDIKSNARDTFREILDVSYSSLQEQVVEAGHSIPECEIDSRYDWIDWILQGVIRLDQQIRSPMTDRIDRVLTHRFWGLCIFAVLMGLVFQSVFSWAAPLSDLIESGVAMLSHWSTSAMSSWGVSSPAWHSFVEDGLFGGVGSILVFIPQIAILFLFIGILEDCGYMARAAYLMDRLMAKVGLCGKAFIPLLSCYACAVPGIMSTRIIENPRDRLTTILIAPLTTCSARLPVYAMLIGAFIPAGIGLYCFGWQIVGLQGMVLVLMYLLGLIAAILTAMLLKRTLLKGDTPGFFIELPSYKVPSVRNVLLRVSERMLQFIRCAGTIIFVMSVLVWAAMYFPHDEQAVDTDPQVVAIMQQMVSVPDTPEFEQERSHLKSQLSHQRALTFQRQSILGRLGRTIEPVFRPLGWDWRIGCSVLASLPAREIVVAALGISFSVDPETDGDAEHQFRDSLGKAVWEGTDSPLFNIPVALSLMVFFTLCVQCSATLATIRRETNSWRWPILAFVYMTVLAYAGAFVTYQVGMWFVC